MHGSWWRETTHFSRQNCWLWTHVSLKMTPVNRDLQRLNQKSLQVSTSLGFTASTPVCSTNTVETQTYFLYAKTHTQRNLYTQMLVLYTEQFLHTEAFTHICFYTKHHKAVFTDRPSHTLTHRCFFTQKRLHAETNAFAHRSCYTQTPLHKESYTHGEAFTRTHLYTQKAFTHRGFYTEKSLHRAAFTRRSFYAQKLLHRAVSW